MFMEASPHEAEIGKWLGKGARAYQRPDQPLPLNACFTSTARHCFCFPPLLSSPGDSGRWHWHS